jgi:hypothetical protein
MTSLIATFVYLRCTTACSRIIICSFTSNVRTKLENEGTHGVTTRLTGKILQDVYTSLRRACFNKAVAAGTAIAEDFAQELARPIDAGVLDDVVKVHVGIADTPSVSVTLRQVQRAQKAVVAFGTDAANGACSRQEKCRIKSKAKAAGAPVPPPDPIRKPVSFAATFNCSALQDVRQLLFNELLLR